MAVNTGPAVKGKGKNSLERELAGAIAAGKAPQFEVLSFGFHKQRRVDDGKVASCFRIEISTLLDGQVVEIADEQAVSQRVKNGAAFEGRLGSVDLMERALRKALIKRWPEIEQHLGCVRIVGYSVFAVDYEHSHHVQVTFKVTCREGKEPHTVTREGVDTLGVTFDSLVTIYHWVAWRLLRRLRGERRENGQS
ncbi:hypothetical protein HZB93_00045 [Candidatus Falkowbacteria bacterium]|nr:hypothetical protein [Candidatus Falkowbacteria bacterium]